MFCVLREDFLFTERRSLPHVLLQQFKKLFYHRCLNVCECQERTQPVSCQLSAVMSDVSCPSGFSPKDFYVCTRSLLRSTVPGYVFTDVLTSDITGMLPCIL